MGAHPLAYSQNNRLVQVTGAGTVLDDYLYNGKGQRIVKTTAEVDTDQGRGLAGIRLYVFTVRDIAHQVRAKGITIPMTDILIAALAQTNHCRIATLDRHFDHFPDLLYAAE